MCGPALWGWRRIRRQGGVVQAFFACTTAALPAPPEAPGLQEYGASVSLERHPPDKVVDEIRCHSQLDESEEKIQAQTPLLFVRFHGILSFCCSLQGQRYGSVLPAFDKRLSLEKYFICAHYFVSSQYWFSIHDQMELFIECCYGSKAYGSDSSHFGPGFSRNACCIYRSAARCYCGLYPVRAGVDIARCHFAFLRVVPS